MLINQQRLLEAGKLLKIICKASKYDVEAWYFYGTVNGQLGHINNAIACFRNAIKINPGFAQAHYGLGEAFANQRKMEDAIKHYQLAIECQSSCPALFYASLGHALNYAGRRGEARDNFHKALQLEPDNPNVCNCLGNIYKDNDQLNKAIRFYEQARACAPQAPTAYHNLGGIYIEQGKFEEAISSYRQALVLHPELYKTHSGLLFCLNYDPELSPETKLKEHKNWGRRHTVFKPAFKVENHVPDSERKIRVGYVSNDMKQHAVSFFFEPLLASHNRLSIETFCYSNTDSPDHTTKRLRKYADNWRDISTDEDDHVCQRIVQDNIDILVDLDGHTGSNRLRVFGMRPAPIQVSYLGYPATTGVRAMDYRLSDNWADPPGKADGYFVEKIIRLPKGFLCFKPLDTDCRIGSLPMLDADEITFGSFNNLAKISAKVIAIWSKILHALPNSRLLLKYRHLQDSNTRDRYLKMFSANGINPGRLTLLGRSDTIEQHLSAYNAIDIALDTFPYNGTTTTCDALWMGVPVITLSGHEHAGRVGHSLLSRVGLEAFIAESPGTYVDLAVQWASRPAELASLRANLRNNFTRSVVCDPESLATDIEAAYRNMWSSWCKDKSKQVW